jgi:hypothetical protein
VALTMMALLLGADSRAKHDTRIEAIRALARLPDNVRDALKVRRPAPPLPLPQTPGRAC